MGTALAETEGAAAAGVDENARAAVLPDEIAAGGAFVLKFGAAGTEDLDSKTVGTTGLGGVAEREGAGE